MAWKHSQRAWQYIWLISCLEPFIGFTFTINNLSEHWRNNWLSFFLTFWPLPRLQLRLKQPSLNICFIMQVQMLFKCKVLLKTFTDLWLWTWNPLNFFTKLLEELSSRSSTGRKPIEEKVVEDNDKEWATRRTLVVADDCWVEGRTSDNRERSDGKNRFRTTARDKTLWRLWKKKISEN